MRALLRRHYATGMLELEVSESISWNRGESQVYRARWQRRKVILIPIPKDSVTLTEFFPSGTSMTQYGFQELKEHPASFWMLWK